LTWKFDRQVFIAIYKSILHFTISGPYHYILWCLDGRKNHHPFKFRYAI
jgi:hypothetical protein